jgi:hypothetical protein
MNFKEISRRKGTIYDLPREERELYQKYGLDEPKEIYIVEFELQVDDLKEIPIDPLVTITQEAIYKQEFEKVEKYIAEIKKRGHKVTINKK